MSLSPDVTNPSPFSTGSAAPKGVVGDRIDGVDNLGVLLESLPNQRRPAGLLLRGILLDQADAFLGELHVQREPDRSGLALHAAGQSRPPAGNRAEPGTATTPADKSQRPKSSFLPLLLLAFHDRHQRVVVDLLQRIQHGLQLLPAPRTTCSRPGLRASSTTLWSSARDSYSRRSFADSCQSDRATAWPAPPTPTPHRGPRGPPRGRPPCSSWRRCQAAHSRCPKPGARAEQDASRPEPW